MRCGFILEDYKTKIEDLNKEEINKCCEEYHSINMDNDYYIFVSKSINLDSDVYNHLLIKMNKKLLRL